MWCWQKEKPQGYFHKFFIQRVVQPWHRLPGAVVESPSLEGLNRHVDVACWVHGLVVSLPVLGLVSMVSEGLFQPK